MISGTRPGAYSARDWRSRSTLAAGTAVASSLGDLMLRRVAQPPNGPNDRLGPGPSVLVVAPVLGDPRGAGPALSGRQHGHLDPDDRAAHDRIAGRRAGRHGAGLGCRLAVAGPAPQAHPGDDLTGPAALGACHRHAPPPSASPAGAWSTPTSWRPASACWW